MEKLGKLNNALKYLDKTLLFITVTCLIISIIGAVLGVFFRYALSTSFQLLEEICRYSIIYGAFAYIGPLIKQNEHLKMDMLSSVLKGRIKYSIELLNSLILFGVFAFLFWSSVKWTVSLLAMNMMTVSGTMLLFIPALAIPIGMFFGCIYSLVQIIHDYYQVVQYKKPRKDIETEGTGNSIPYQQF